MPDGCPEQRRCFLEGTDARQDFQLHTTPAVGFHFVEQGGHAIDASVAGADDADGLSSFGQLESLLGACLFPTHAGVDATGTGAEIGRDELEVILIADDDVRATDGFDDGRCDVPRRTRTDTDDVYLCLFHKWLFKLVWWAKIVKNVRWQFSHARKKCIWRNAVGKEGETGLRDDCHVLRKFTTPNVPPHPWRKSVLHPAQVSSMPEAVLFF